MTIQKPLQAKAALVTGGSRGIGRAIAVGLATQGASVVIGYHKNDARAREVVKTIADAGRKATAVPGDLSGPAEVTRLFDAAEQAVGRLDIVVANAADIVVKPLADCTEEDYDRTFDTNTKGVFFTLKEAARRLNDGAASSLPPPEAPRCFSPSNRFISAAKVQSSNSSGPCRGSSAVGASRSTRSPRALPTRT